MHAIFEDGESRSFFMSRFAYIYLPDVNLPNGFHE